MQRAREIVLWALAGLALLAFAVWLGLSLANHGYSCVAARVLVCHRTDQSAAVSVRMLPESPGSPG